MKRIPLTQGLCAIVDDEDYEWLNQWKWCAANHNGHWYAVRRENGREQSMHRQILDLRFGDKRQTDHIDGDGLTNKRTNLRVCTPAQNQYNQKQKTASSKFKGVRWHKKARKWQAQIQFKQKVSYIGLFISEIDAARAYDEKAIELFGELANLNFSRKERENGKGKKTSLHTAGV